MNEKDGGPAYPASFYSVTDGKAEPSLHPFSGMTLRDYFATAALSSICAKIGMNAALEVGLVSRACFDLADSMLAERERRGK